MPKTQIQVAAVKPGHYFMDDLPAYDFHQSNHTYPIGMFHDFSLFRCLELCSIMSLFVAVKLLHCFLVASQTTTIELSWLIAMFSEALDLSVTFDRSKHNPCCVCLIFLQLTPFAHFLFGIHLGTAFTGHVMHQHLTRSFSSLSHRIFIPASEQVMGSLNSYLCSPHSQRPISFPAQTYRHVLHLSQWA